ncbi:coiled-coil domain-containing protein 25 isoform X1 [Phyllobates terribilis]|uniref:coiled-coil domain-containing protein 25 isoform X1 n=1 Tax=Phyllobates terribilis TaxID=111132 RepID=UPI003CCAC458
MVFYFTSNVASPPYTIYMGKDKYENEDLIKYGWPEDVWFHVDKLSSAHVYLRLHKGQTMDDIPKDVLTDCAHLVKANSIQGCKMNNINVVYTAWSNLRKTGDMDVGQIGFHRQKDKSYILYIAMCPADGAPEPQGERGRVHHTSCNHGVRDLLCEEHQCREESQRDPEPVGKNKRRAIPGSGGREGISRPGGEEREESSDPGDEEEREGRSQEEERDGGTQELHLLDEIGKYVH